jgi:hypothetical protein
MPFHEDAGPAFRAFLAGLGARPRLLALGEPTHGVEDFLHLSAIRQNRPRKIRLKGGAATKGGEPWARLGRCAHGSGAVGGATGWAWPALERYARPSVDAVGDYVARRDPAARRHRLDPRAPQEQAIVTAAATSWSLTRRVEAIQPKSFGDVRNGRVE